MYILQMESSTITMLNEQTANYSAAEILNYSSILRQMADYLVAKHAITIIAETARQVDAESDTETTSDVEVEAESDPEWQPRRQAPLPAPPRQHNLRPRRAVIRR
jgi:hypothetical protein